MLRTTLSCFTDLKQSSFAVYNCVTAEEVETQIIFRKTEEKTKKHPIYELIILKGHHERLPDSNISIQFRNICRDFYQIDCLFCSFYIEPFGRTVSAMEPAS